ncbi:methyl-accepting chemotaxis domain protein [Candidatus Erwinia dacicola]|uniref:Methyl-accepting chemotaxis domain protein n=1 Tax=Candidatus Erwinia dacicola TaxID=252393 RepID=A0A328TLP1_9GAMM|nr:hypothetical protein [Candidatus Erwinia dacicola]RAP71348.1 methyl-accepting chemotaxis domain protein [Candidatus Erwinia dacicola]
MFEQDKRDLLDLVRARDITNATEVVLRKITTTQNAFFDIVVAFADSQSG